MSLDPKQPVIVIGMHRSGTTMVTRVLEQLGVFMGTNLSHNAESHFVVALNDWLLWQGSAAWDQPLPFRDVLDHEPVMEMAADYVRLMLGSPRSARFVGRAHLARGRTAMTLPAPWGFKDPRTTFTLPVFLRLWPDARVISVTRHGVDVASSLKVRADQRIPESAERYRKLRPAYLLRSKHDRMARLVATLRCARLDGAFELWDEYETEARRHVAALEPRALRVRYEDFLQDPATGIRAVAAFCSLPADDATVARVAAGVDAGRAFAFEAREELRAFSAREDVAGALRRHGYEPTIAGATATGTGTAS